MINNISTNTIKATPHAVAETLTRVEPKVVIALGGMLCFTVMYCIRCIVAYEYEVRMSSNELSITKHDKNEVDESYAL